MHTQSAHSIAQMLYDGQLVPELVLKLVSFSQLSFALIGCAAGPKRRKVMRTAINDRGEEVTEEIWEDNQDASTPEEQDEQADGKQPEESAARSPVSKSPEKASQDDALKEQPGQCIC